MRVTWARRAILVLGAVLAVSACGGDSGLKVAVAVPNTRAESPSAAAAQSRPASPVAAPSAAGGSSRDTRAQAPAQQALTPGTITPGARLQIPAIGVDAPIITLGVDPDGRMQVPDNGADVAWYDFSAVPGRPGNAVLSGHLDTATSKTAVFSRLHQLKLGDLISVVEGSQRTDFSVFWTRSWPDASAPLNLILGKAPSPTLTLITCSGTFDRASSNYTERLVVRAKLPGSI
jgi:LPXTG-site transpeptidase (sortase) family protein